MFLGRVYPRITAAASARLAALVFCGGLALGLAWPRPRNNRSRTRRLSLLRVPRLRTPPLRQCCASRPAACRNGPAGSGLNARDEGKLQFRATRGGGITKRS